MGTKISTMKVFVSTLLLLALVGNSLAGFRCTFGDWACSAGCVTLGQTSGICDDNGKCWCSERSISLDDIKALLPSRCDLGTSVCEGTCHSIGRKSGTCTDTGCDCSEEKLSPEEFGLCAAESTCRIHCQAQGKGSGTCKGWQCECESQAEQGEGGQSN